MSDFTQDFLTSRRNFADGNTRIGEEGRLWYDSITNTIRISDGITPGGIIVCSGGGGGGSGFSWIKISTTQTAIAFGQYILDSSGGSFTLNLPPFPSLGDTVVVTDGSDLSIHPVVIGSNGNTIEGSTNNVVLDYKNLIVWFVYDGSTWQISANSGPRGFSGYSGRGIELAGVVSTSSDLPNGIPIGELYIATDTGDGWVSNGDNTWTNVGPLQGPVGPIGISGYSGASGYGIDLAGVVNTESNLPDGVPAGELYITTDTGDGWVSNGDNTWTNVGPLQGPSGFSGFSGAPALNWTKISTTQTAISFKQYILDSSGGSFTLNLPSSPFLGDTVVVTDGANLSIHPVVIGSNGNTIEGSTNNVVLDYKNLTVWFVYDGNTWQISVNSGPQGASGYSGRGIQLAGVVSTSSNLPTGISAGQLYITTDTGDGWVSNGDNTWTNIGPLQGPTGLSGYSGYSGYGIQLAGVVNTAGDLPNGVPAGDLYITTDTGDGWVSNGDNTWTNIGPLQGLSGFSGFSGAPALNWTKISTTQTAIPFKQYILDSSGGSFTLNLPSSPFLGDTVVVTDGANLSVYPVIIGSNGNTIEGSTNNVVLDYKNLTVWFVYDGTTWQISVNSGPQGASGYSGYGIELAGVVSTESSLPTGISAGQLYITTDTGDGWVSNGDNTWTNIGPLQGPTGLSGYSGASGYGIELAGVVSTESSLPTGISAGQLYITTDTGDGWVSNGDNTWTNIGPLQGPSGISGYSGFSGAAGSPGDSNLIWSVSGIYRTLTSYRNPDTTISKIRVAEFSNNLLRLTLASFTPSLIAIVTPATSLNWDVPTTGFNISVTNPDDIPNEYISAVSGITTVSGAVAAFINFVAGTQSATPGPGVDWTQSFSIGGTGYIRSTSTTISGGSASANVFFNYWNGSTVTSYTDGNATFSVVWATPTISLTLGALSGATFLQTYLSTSYTLTVTGISNSANYSNSLSAVGGSLSDLTGNGTFTFAAPIHKNNVATVRTVSDTTTFTRPATITGTSYTATLSTTTSNPSVTFTYPSLWVFTSSTLDIPTRSTYVSGSNFAAGVTVLGNQSKVINGYITNSSTLPQGLWMAVRTSAAQPTQFKTGASPSLLSDVVVVTGNTVGLAPDVVPPGYFDESYTLYGITLQSGTTYVSIS